MCCSDEYSSLFCRPKKAPWKAEQTLVDHHACTCGGHGFCDVGSDAAPWRYIRSIERKDPLLEIFADCNVPSASNLQ